MGKPAITGMIVCDFPGLKSMRDRDTSSWASLGDWNDEDEERSRRASMKMHQFHI